MTRLSKRRDGSGPLPVFSPADVSSAAVDAAGPANGDDKKPLLTRGPRHAVAKPATLLIAAMVVTDLIGIAFGHVLAAFLADLLRVKVGLGDAVAWQLLQERDRAIVLLSLLTVGIFAFGGLYRRNTWESDEIRRIVTGVALIALFDVALQFIVRDHFSRLWFLTAYPTIALSVLVFRMSLRSLPAVQTAMTSHIVLLGDGTPPDLFVDQLRESRSGKVKLLGNIPLDQIAGRDPTALQKLVLRLARDASIDPQRVVIIVSPSMAEAERAQEVMALLDASKTSYSIVLPFDGLARGGLDLQKVIGSDMILAEVRNESWNVAAQLVKRGFDLLAASLVFVVLLPLLTVISVCLLAEGGPIFFKQLRVGRNGNRFWCYKFRSMRPDAEERLADLLASDLRARTEWSVHQKLSHDPRITRFGATLRKTSLDELPQLINVFRGDMSLVGPRPIVAPEVPGYPGDHSYYESEGIKYYLSARPGVTGLWQVSGRASTTHEERVRLDRWYVRNWSVWLDLTILLKTVRVVFNGRGSS